MTFGCKSLTARINECEALLAERGMLDSELEKIDSELPKKREAHQEVQISLATLNSELAKLKALLIQEGADTAGMSGSGSALFGLFREQKHAAQAAEALRKAEGSPLVYGPFVFED